jgi:hypothetical protein
MATIRFQRREQRCSPAEVFLALLPNPVEQPAGNAGKRQPEDSFEHTHTPNQRQKRKTKNVSVLLYNGLH